MHVGTNQQNGRPKMNMNLLYKVASLASLCRPMGKGGMRWIGSGVGQAGRKHLKGDTLLCLEITLESDD